MKMYVNTTRADLVKLAIQNNEADVTGAKLTNNGMLCVETGRHTGRAANDKFIVYDDITANTVDWSSNKKFTPENFQNLRQKMREITNTQECVFYCQGLTAGIGDNSLNFSITTTNAWHALFAQTMFYPCNDIDSCDWHIFHAPDFWANPEIDNTNSEAFIILNFTEKMVLIGGTHYAGEIKKSIFTILNFLLPDKKVLPMHSSVNVDQNNNSTIFFGLSGTGKTTLSADNKKILIGDDEHGWREDGTIFNFEDGCYAKAIKLSKENEPEIWEAVHQFGTVLENVKIINSECDFNDASLTENTRAAYKLSNIKNASITRETEPANNIIMLACDAYGVLPPLSKLTPQQAAYYFLSGYTAKVAGTEAGIKEPVATFSTCFGAPFLPRQPVIYANMLMERIKKYNCNVYLVNTGWIGGGYGVGKRIDLQQTRMLVDFALSSKEDKHFIFYNHPIFNFSYLTTLFDLFTNEKIISSKILMPSLAWENNGSLEYLTHAQELANKFKNNFKKYESQVSADILNAGPK